MTPVFEAQMTAKHDFTRAVMTSLLENEPISHSELRELTLRHIMTNPYDPGAAPLTANLLDACSNLPISSGGAKTITFEEVCLMFGGDPPPAIPRDCKSYPEELMVQVAICLSKIS